MLPVGSPPALFMESGSVVVIVAILCCRHGVLQLLLLCCSGSAVMTPCLWGGHAIIAMALVHFGEVVNHVKWVCVHNYAVYSRYCKLGIT